jgi:hypothetical protein
MNGVDGGIGEFTNINSYAYKRFHSSFPAILTKVTSGRELTQEEAITPIRVLITIQAEVTPSQVGRDSRIVVLPMRGAGSVSSYPDISALPANTTNTRKEHE